GIFYVTGTGFLGPKYRLRTYFPEVAGVSNGAPGRLDGGGNGNVEAIKMVPRADGKDSHQSRHIENLIRGEKRFQDNILTDSTATLVTEGLLGNRYVNIARGFTGVPLKDNQEVAGTAEKSLSDVMASVQGLTVDIHGLIASMQEGKGTIGKLLTD